MRLLVTIAAVFFLAAPAQAQQTFEQVWAAQWRPKITGSILSRRFEPQLKAACKEVWETAQANVVAASAAAIEFNVQPDETFVRGWAADNKVEVILNDGSWYKQIYLRPRLGYVFRFLGTDKRAHAISSSFVGKENSWPIAWKSVSKLTGSMVVEPFPMMTASSAVGCKCDDDPRGCVCKPTGEHQKHNYPCGDIKCPWNNLSKPTARKAPAVYVSRSRSYQRPRWFPRLRRKR